VSDAQPPPSDPRGPPSDPPPLPSDPPPARGGGLREALARYVTALHEAYLAAAGEHAGELPLAAGRFTVAVVAADRLHLLATRDALPPQRPHERPTESEAPPLRWQVRFLDASVVPALARGDAARVDVPHELGVTTVLYHLLVEVDATLDDHHAMHAGTGLAHAHLAAREPDA
jgi:hypothetical protein